MNRSHLTAQKNLKVRQYRREIVPQMRRRRACAPVLVLVTIIIPTDNIFLKLHWHRQLAGRQNVQNEPIT
jgi:hypothetical protein